MAEITVFVAGDVVNYTNMTGELCASELTKIISSADYSICNFEAPVSGAGVPQPKVGPYHHQRGQTLAGLKRQGFDLVLLANNHIMDFGPDGLAATLGAASDAGLDVIGAGLDGAAAYRSLIKEINGFRLGMINACEAQFGVLDFFCHPCEAGYAWLNSYKIDQAVIYLRQFCDFVMIFAHAGLENYSIPQKEWRERYRHLCDLGADTVVGAHPHVPQGYESHSGSLIFYSLGNFYFDSNKYITKKDSTYSVLLRLSKEFGISFTPVYHYKSEGLVRLAPPTERIDLKQLCDRLGSDYGEEHDNMCLKVYGKIHENLRLSTNPFPFDRDPISAAKRLVASVFGRTKPIDKDLLQLHMLRNEAYYFAARHALELKVRSKYRRALAASSTP